MVIGCAGGAPDNTWTVAQTHIVRSMQYGSRIRTWRYNEGAILCGMLSVEENLDLEAQLLSKAVERDHLEVFSGITRKMVSAKLISFKVNERPIIFVTYSLGVLIVKRVSSGD